MKPQNTQIRREGQGLVEFALILPVLLFTVMGIIDFGRAMIVYSQASNAIRNAARYAEVWGGEHASEHQYLECGENEAIQNLAEQVMFANVSSEIVFVKKGFFEENEEHTLNCDEAKTAPEELTTGDMLILKSTGSFNTITPLISSFLPTLTFEFRAQRTIIANLNIGTTTGGESIPSCSFGATEPEVMVRASQPSTLPEGGSGSFTFTLCTASSETVTVNYTVSGTATPGVGFDYSGISSGSVTFLPGQVSQTIPVQIYVDEVQEDSAETIILTLQDPPNAALGTPASATLIIMNDDPAGLCSDAEVYAAVAWGANSNSLGMRFKVINIGSRPLTVSSLRLRYYYTLDDQTATQFYNHKDGDSVAAIDNHASDGYFDIRFSGSGVVQPNQAAFLRTTLELYQRQTNGGWANQNHTNDYSGANIPANNTEIKTTRIPLFENETIICGDPPVNSGDGGDGTTPVVNLMSIAPVTEGGTATVNLSFQPATTANISVTYRTLNGTAVSPDDFTGTSSSTVNIPQGATTATFTIPITGNDCDEPDETFTVELLSASGATLGSSKTATATIPDADPSPRLSINNVTVYENADFTTDAIAAFTVTLEPKSCQTVTVGYASQDYLGAIAGTDYVPVNGTLTFAPGETSKTISVTVKSDSVGGEGDEKFRVVLSGPTNANLNVMTGTASIVDAGSANAPFVSINQTATAPEGGWALFTLTLDAPPHEDIVVYYSTSEGPSPAATTPDYNVVTSGQATIPAGTTIFELRPIYMIEDGIDEFDETFYVTLTGTSNANIARISPTNNRSTVTITDSANDGPPTLIIEDIQITEGQNSNVDAWITVSLSPSRVSGKPITMTYSTANGSSGNRATADVDYTAVNGQSFTIDAGTYSKQVKVTIKSDTLDEDDEYFLVNFAITDPSRATFAGGSNGDSQVRVTIVDSDDAPTVSIGNATAIEPSAGNTNTAIFTVTLAPASSKTVTVHFRTENAGTGEGYATAGSDYTAISSGTLTFAPGETSKTIPVDILPDNFAEATSETFKVALFDITNAQCNSACTGTGTLQDAPASNIKVSIKFPETDTVNQKEIRIHLFITNNGTTSVPLSELTLRYYFNREGTVDQNYITDYAQNTSNWSGISGDVHGALNYGNGINSYVQISFGSGAGSLSAGASAYVEMRLHTSDWSNIIDETNDYSFHPDVPSAWVDWNKVTLYRNGALIWGLEPS
jgi:hypothetical protein